MGENIPEWCVLSELRLFKGIVEHKPAGITGHFQMACLVDLMNRITSEEEELEDFVSADDYDKLISEEENQDRMHCTHEFAPLYSVRPDAAEIRAKLDAMYDMETIEEFEYMPEEFEKKSDFFLPEGDFSELMKKKEESTITQTPPPTTTTTTSQPTPTNATTSTQKKARKRKKERQDSGQSSRSSTPQGRKEPRRS